MGNQEEKAESKPPRILLVTREGEKDLRKPKARKKKPQNSEVHVDQEVFKKLT